MAEFIKLSEVSINIDWIASIQFPKNADEVPEEKTPDGALLLDNPTNQPPKELALVRLGITDANGAPIVYTFEKGTEDYKTLRSNSTIGSNKQIGKVSK